MKKFNWFKKVLLFSLPVAGLGIATPIILTSCGTSNSSEPRWKSSGLPSIMTLENHNNAVIKLGTTGFWTTGLTSNSKSEDVSKSISDFTNGLGKLNITFLYVPSLGWSLDVSLDLLWELL